MKVTVEKETWFITDGEIKHIGKLAAGESYETIVDVLTFDNEEEWKKKVKELGLVDLIEKSPFELTEDLFFETETLTDGRMSLTLNETQPPVSEAQEAPTLDYLVKMEELIDSIIKLKDTSHERSN